MTSGSIGSHRAFLGVCITLCVCLALTLFVGWRWYFEVLVKRSTLIGLAEKNDERIRELENLGLSIDAAMTKAEPPTLPALPTASPTEPTSETPSKSAAPAPARDDQPPAASTIEELPLKETGDDVVQALALLEQYWQTEKWQDRVPLVAHSERVAALMKDYYETQGGTDPAPSGLAGKARYLIDGSEILYFSYTSNRPTGSLEIAMLRDPQGKFLIDWESLVGYGELSFADFRQQRPSKPVILRAYVRLFEYYNFEFADSSKYICVKLTSENGASSLYAYCQRGTALARWLESDLASTGPSSFKGYTMRVAFPPDAKSNQCVLLDKVITPRWLMLGN